MGGELTARSEPGKGSTFTARLPVHAAGVASAADAAASEPEAAAAPPAPGRSDVVLVIDDDRTARELIAGYLEEQRITVVAAAGGIEGLRRARELRPAAITLDVLMADLSGWDVLAALKGDPDLAAVPVIVTTIVDEPHKGMALGAADYLTKPIDRERLLRTLARYVTGERKPRILVVEDDAAQRQIVRTALEPAGYAVDEAKDGREGLACLRAAIPNLIVLDLLMPEMDGFEFAAALQVHPDWRRIPVIVVTAKDLTPDDRRRLESGVAKILLKHEFDPSELVDQLRRSLAARAAA
jgi:CheY-like chemotaxis protein